MLCGCREGNLVSDGNCSRPPRLCLAVGVLLLVCIIFVMIFVILFCKRQLVQFSFTYVELRLLLCPQNNGNYPITSPQNLDFAIFRLTLQMC